MLNEEKSEGVFREPKLTNYLFKSTKKTRKRMSKRVDDVHKGQAERDESHLHGCALTGRMITGRSMGVGYRRHDSSRFDLLSFYKEC